MTGTARFYGPPSARCPQGIYRSFLSRPLGLGPRVCLFIMLNPSTANATDDDPTIRRCIGFASREGAGELWVCNLFALRATDPRELYEPGGAPEGDPENVAEILDRARRADLVVCAWGNHGKLRGRAAHVRFELMRASVRPFALKKTSAGVPCHPLYLRADAPLVAL